MALIDRNFQGFGKELFTDAGKYVIHFGDKPMEAATQATKTIQAAHPDKPAPAVTAVAKYRNPDMQVIATSTADQLVRPCFSPCRTHKFTMTEMSSVAQDCWHANNCYTRLLLHPLTAAGLCTPRYFMQAGNAYAHGQLWMHDCIACLHELAWNTHQPPSSRICVWPSP